MKKFAAVLGFTAMMTMFAAGAAMATPSTQIWIPSTDVQAFKTFHLGLDSYVRTAKESNGSRLSAVYDAGIEAGVLPFEKLQMEVGVDYLVGGTNFDDYPVYFNAKLATPEESLFKGSPALAIGGCNFGTSADKAHNTAYDMSYVLVAKTLPVIGRLSAGYYLGNASALKDIHGKTENHGVLASWDRTMTEISDKLWVAVDYQGGDNSLGAVNFGVAWAFTKNVSVILGYDVYNSRTLGGAPTFTTQLDINFP